jgi:hypothetical protein
LDFEVSADIINKPIANKDFGILVEAKDDGDSGTIAYSYPCAYSKTGNRPLWGLFHWNKFYMNQFDSLTFQNNVYAAIHEITHLLGFSQLYYEYF